MNRIILKTINVRSFVRDKKNDAAQERINEFISNNNLNVISASLFIQNEDIYLFTLTCE